MLFSQIYLCKEKQEEGDHMVQCPHIIATPLLLELYIFLHDSLGSMKGSKLSVINSWTDKSPKRRPVCTFFLPLYSLRPASHAEMPPLDPNSRGYQSSDSNSSVNTCTKAPRNSKKEPKLLPQNPCTHSGHTLSCDIT